MDVTSEMTGMGLRKGPRDPRDYPVPRQMLRLTPPTSRYWITGPVLDQGGTPHCVEYSGRGLLLCNPVKNDPPDPYGSIYAWCQQHDEWPGEGYDGTSVHALMKWLRAEAYCSSYEWALTIAELEAHVLLRGPAVVGTDWFAEMFVPDRWGFIQPVGGVVGGHAWLITGANRKQRKFRLRNSWGKGWGVNGNAWITYDHMEQLIQAEGEIALPVEVRNVRSY